MPASNHNWVCFDCRFATRSPKTDANIPKCIHCGDNCYCLGYKVEIPKKSDKSAWQKLRLECRRRELGHAKRLSVQRVREKHEAQRRISRLKSLDTNKDRAKLIEALQKST